jgi:hypothetical protein
MRRLIYLICLAFGLSAAAANSTFPKETVESDKERVITVPVPQAQIEVHPPQIAPPRPLEFEFNASTWSPVGFTRGSYTGEVSRLEKNDVPALSINRYSELAGFGGGVTLSTLFGLSYLGLERSKSQSLGPAANGTVTQNVNLIMARAGLATEWGSALPWGISPVMSFALLPTWATADQSAYEKSVGAFGVPVEASVGLLWRTSMRASLMRGDMSFGVSAQAISGSVGGSSMKGNGIEGVFRISL